MDRDAIRAFVARDRERVAALKRDHHAKRHRASRGTSGLEAARALREYARKVRSDWPTARDRAEDFAHHVALKRRIDRAAHAFFAASSTWSGFARTTGRSNVRWTKAT